MSAQEYYSDSQYPGHGPGYGNQGPMPPAGYPAYSPAAAAFPPSANNIAYSSHNGSGYQYQPQEYYGGYQQTPASQQQQPQQTYPRVTDQDVHANQDHNDRGALRALAGGAAGAYAGHQVNHGVLGTIGGAIAGSLAEDAIKKHGFDGRVTGGKRCGGFTGAVLRALRLILFLFL
ncbi:hypothetical protein BDV11DRAFT_172086 [Aspergillus similis]